MPKGSSFRKLTPDEIRNATMHHWRKFKKTTIIPYSFDLSLIPEHIKEYALQKYSQSTFDPLNSDSISWLKKVLHQWEEACGESIKFTYVDKIKANAFTGIVIANCDNLKNANGYWRQVFTSSGQYQFDLICIPSSHFDKVGKLMPYQVRTISHEIGHALGLGHLHDVESIRLYLKNTTEGMGASVMPYLTKIESNTSLCVDMDVCFNSTFGVMPGPFDAQMCQAIYGEDSLFFTKPGKLDEMIKYTWHGAALGNVLGLRTAMEYLFERLGSTHASASLKSFAIYYSIAIVQIVYSSNATDFSTLFELVQQLMIPVGSELFALTLNLLADYLHEQKMHTLSNTIAMASASLKIFALGGGIIEAAQQSYHETWNYGAAIISGIASYGFISTIGKCAVNCFLGPEQIKNDKVVEEVPQQGGISSLWGFFGTRKTASVSEIEDDSDYTVVPF